jgi:predicted nucleic acid-binding protein
VIVADASVLVTAVTDAGAGGQTARARLSSDEVAIPHLADIEVVSGIRGLLLGGRLTEDQATLAVRGFRTLPLLRFDHGPLLARCWELRANLTSYDGAYVALAELLEISLLTEDARLARAPGLACTVEVLPS